MPAVTRTLTAADGTTIAYVVRDGDEPTVVLLHGLAGSGLELAATASALAPRRTIVIDQRGHGASTRHPADVSREALVSDVVEVIAAEATAPVDLVGHSMGGHTAMLVAATRPELVHRLVLLESTQGGGTRDEHEAMADYFRSWPVPFATRDAAREWLGDGPLADAWTADLEQRSDGLHPRFDPDVMLAAITPVAVPRWAEWESITAPTLAVFAERGMFTTAEQSAFVARGRTVSTVTLPSASHDAHLDAPDAWITALAAFLGDPA